MAVLDDTTTADLIENWYKSQYVREVQLRREVASPKSYKGRLGMINGWRLQPHISIWLSLPGEEPPTSWPRKPTLATLNKQAREAWDRCDRDKAKELYYMWTHACTDPYYCPMHGFGSD
jgi:hypothetical protein